MLNGRLYRAAFLPFLLALAVAAFALGSQPMPRTHDARARRIPGRTGVRGSADPRAALPERRPGSPGDDGLARYVAGALPGPGQHRRRRVHGARAPHRRADDRRRAAPRDRRRRAPGLDARVADPDRRPPRRRQAGLACRDVRDGCAARARPCVRRPGDEAHHRARLHERRQRRRRGRADPALGPRSGGRPRPVRRRDRAGRPRRREPAQADRRALLRRPGLGAARTHADRLGRDRARIGLGSGRAEHARPARPPRLPHGGGGTGRAERAGIAGCARAGERRTRAGAFRAHRRQPPRRARPRRAERGGRARRRPRPADRPCRPGS